MTSISARAARQIDDLIVYYDWKDRPEAAENLALALQCAALRIEQTLHAGLRAPRPYPSLARTGRYWIKEGVYWFQYLTADDPVITAVFHESADIPGRL